MTPPDPSVYVDLDTWANCPTPDCQWKVCTWARTGVCCPCSVALVGQAEVDRRFTETHPDDPA